LDAPLAWMPGAGAPFASPPLHATGEQSYTWMVQHSCN